MEQARLQCQPHPAYGYPTEAAAAWMTARRDTPVTTDPQTDMTPTNMIKVPSPVKFHQHRSSPYPSPVMGHSAARISVQQQASAPRSAMARRNERERKRVRLVNHGFATLRQYLPQSNNSRKKLSKMETLRSAIEYIKQLQFLLDPTSSSSSTAPSPQHQYGETSSDPPSWSASGPPSWDDSWVQQQQQPSHPQTRSPSPTHASLSPETDLIDFAAFS